jgi:hypothetical protein
LGRAKQLSAAWVLALLLVGLIMIAFEAPQRDACEYQRWRLGSDGQLPEGGLGMELSGRVLASYARGPGVTGFQKVLGDNRLPL